MRPVKVFRRLPPQSDRPDCALTIGNFDGVHRGHQALINRLIASAREAGLASCVLTFEPHPREYFALAHPGSRAAPARISTLRDKLAALAALGIDRVCVAHFNQVLASMTPQAFARDVLFEGLRARHLLIGDDFRFGAKRAGDRALLERIASDHRATVDAIQTVALPPSGASSAGSQHGIPGGPSNAGSDSTPAPTRVSSSAVREALAGGDLERVRLLLGRPYTLSGRVIHGRKLGRTLGFPTMNLRFAHGRPALTGIYVVRIRGLATDPQTRMNGVASLGTRPAVEADGRHLLEVHLPDWSGNAYGKLLEVEFVKKLRGEQPFESLEALTDQIREDVLAARAYFSMSGLAAPDSPPLLSLPLHPATPACPHGPDREP